METRFDFARLSISLCFAISVVGLAACRQDDAPTTNSTTESRPPLPIRVAVVDDMKLSNAIEREWHATAETDIEIINLDDSSSNSSFKADVIIFAAAEMGDLTSTASKLRIRALPYSQSDRQLVELTDIMTLTRQHEMTWGKELHALTIGSPQFCLLCRSDIFELLNLELPRTWAEYQNVVKALTANENQKAIRDKLQSDGGPLIGEPLSEGWAAKSFLSRAAAYAKTPSEFSCLFSIIDFSPRIASPPFERALNELRDVVRIGGNQIAAGTPHELMEQLVKGQLAMVMSWPTAWRNDSDIDVLPIDIGALPGSNEYYNRLEGDWSRLPNNEIRMVPLTGITGRFAAILSGGNVFEAKNFLVWLATPGNSVVTCRSSETAPFRNSQRNELSQWLPAAMKPISQQYFDLLEASQSSAVALSYPRFANQKRYMDVLDQAVRESLASEESSNEILISVANRWKTITEELGKDSQLSSYLESLNINPMKR